MNHTPFFFRTCLLAGTLAGALSALEPLKAFPSAEGFGKYAKGGRGGEVYRVTHLGDAGPGSFRDAVSQPNRTVVFAVGGVIRLESVVYVASNITVAGQTAPGDGISLYGAGVYIGQTASGTTSNDVILRHMRIRLGSRLPVGKTLEQVIPATDVAGRAKYNAQGTDVITILRGKNMILDHLSLGWGRDGTLDINNNNTTRIIDSITVQNTLIAHTLKDDAGTGSKGSLVRVPGSISFLRNAFMHNRTRNPQGWWSGQFVNNVLYNWDKEGMFLENPAAPTKMNITDNYFISGSWNRRLPIAGGGANINGYLQGNYWDSKNTDSDLNGVLFTDTSKAMVRPATAFAFPPLAKLRTAQEAYAWVLDSVGASRKRDQVDNALMAELKTMKSAGYLIRTEDTLATKGPGVVAGGVAPMDTDLDGMPDAWEQAKGLNPNLASDRNGTQLSADGYTNLEMYLNELAGDPVVYVNQVPTVTWSLTQSATSAGTQLSVQSTPVDRDGRVAKVDVLHNGVVVKTLLAAPWNADLAGVPAGNHVVQLRVTDNQGAVVVSEAKYATVLGRSGLRVLENPWRGIANMEFQLTATQTKQKVSFRVIRVGAGLVRAFTLANPTTGLNRMRVVSSKTYPAGNYQIVMLLDGVVYETVLARKF